jgi:hypothetical protein
VSGRETGSLVCPTSFEVVGVLREGWWFKAWFKLARVVQGVVQGRSIAEASLGMLLREGTVERVGYWPDRAALLLLATSEAAASLLRCP